MPPIPGRARRGHPPAILLLTAALGAGCGRAASAPPSPPAGPIAPVAEECVLRPPGPGSTGPAAGGLRAAVDSGYAGLFDPRRRHTPVALSCTGEPRPRLAASWSRDSLGLAWTIVLLDSASGAPSAAELLTAWRERPYAAAALQWAGVRSIVPLDARRLVLTFGTPHESLPAVLAAPALAFEPDSAEPWPTQVTTGSPSDLRDALDAGAELVVTADAEVLEYAASLPGTALAPLPWNRTYVLLIAPGTSGLAGITGADSLAFRESLAGDAVRAAARAAQPPFWWEEPGECPARASPDVSQRSGSVIYPAADPVARALAERVVALAGSPTVTAGEVAAGAFPGVVASGAHAGYVVPLPRVPLLPCLDVARWPAGFSPLPLIETRPTAVLRAGTPPVRVSWDGALAPLEAP